MPDSFESRLRKSLKSVEEMKTPSCLETETIGLYIEDKLPGGERMRVEKHIASCLYCLDQLVELRELVYFQKHSAPLPSHLLQKIVDLYPKEERPIKAVFQGYFFFFRSEGFRFLCFSCTPMAVRHSFLCYRISGYLSSDNL